MANVFRNIEYLNTIEPSKDYCSAFELSDVLQFKFEHEININHISLFRGSNVYGFCYEINLFFKDISVNSAALLRTIDDSDFACCSSDGIFVALFTKSKALYLIFTPDKLIFLKHDLRLKNECIYGMKLIEINENTSEIWLFARNKVIVIRNIDFSRIFKVVAGNDNQQKSNLSQQIKLDYVSLHFTDHQSEIVDVNVVRCQNYNQIMIGILYWNVFALMIVSTNDDESSVMLTHSVELEDIGIDLCQNSSASIGFASDDMNVFILDGKNTLWIYNFLTESICGTLTNAQSDKCLRFMVSRNTSAITDTIVFVNEIDNNSATLDLISFPKMDVIDKFPVANNSIIMPFHHHTDSILIIQPVDNVALLKCISRLDPNIKLREIIAMGNHEQARKFATIYGLDQEIIYIDELHRLIKEWDNNQQSLTSDQQIRLHCCIQELQTYFDFDIFMQLIIISMSSFVEQQSHLIALNNQALKHISSIYGNKIYDMVTRECARFRLFAIMYSPVDYSIQRWNVFRNEDSETIWFTAINQADINAINEIWKLLQSSIESIFTTSNAEFCQHLKAMGTTMINKQYPASKFKSFFDWLSFDVIPKQIETSPEQLAYLIDVIDVVIRKLEATHNLEYRNEIAFILECIIANVEKIHLTANTPKMKAHVIAARLTSGLERVNPLKRLISLKNDLYQIQRLFNNFSLDLNLDVLTNETGISLAIRILDQTSNNDLANVAVWDKFRSFLREFEIRETEFYLHYIYQKLINRVSFKSESSANDSSGEYSMIFTRFMFLLDKVEDKQAQLEGLAEFAAHADMPFKEQLNSLIQLRIASNSSSNPVVGKLQQLLTTSKLTPMCNRYGIKFNIKNFNCKKLLFHILQNESDNSADQCQSDIDIIMREFNLEEIVLLEQKCHVYVNDIFFKEEIISYESFKKLSKILVSDKLTISIKISLLKFSFNKFNYLMNQIYIWNYDALEFISEVGYFMAEKLPEEGSKSYFLELFGILQFCIKLQSHLNGNKINISQILGKDFSLSDLAKVPNFRQKTIYNFFYDQFMIYFNSTIDMDNFDCFKATGKCFELIQSKKDFCIKSLNLKNDYFRIILNVLASIGQQFISNSQLQATYAIYNGLEIIIKCNEISNDICRYSPEIRNLLAVLLEIDITSNIFMIYKIMETLQKILGIYIVNNIKYHSQKYNILQRTVVLMKSLTRNFACLQKPEYFHVKQFTKTLFQEKPNLLDSLTDFVQFMKSGLALIFSLDENFDNALMKFENECKLVLPLFLENNLYISGYLSGLSLLVLLSSDKASTNSLYTQIDSKEKICLKAWKHVLKSRILDVSLLSGIILICSPSVAYREIETLIRKCSKNNKVLLTLYSIAFRVLQNYGDNDIPNRFPTIRALQKEVHKKMWSMKLNNFNINIKSLNKSDLNKTKLEIFQHPKMTLNIVEQFLEDFHFPCNKYYFEYFREIVKTDLSTCSSFEEYKLDIERLIGHAEKIWNRIHISNDFINEIIYELGNSICNSSQYQYELLVYLYDKLNSFNGDYSWEIKIIKLLDSWHRISPATIEEINFVQKFHSRNAEYLMIRRLPFHAVIGDNPMSVIGPELNDMNTSVWLEIYNSINQMKTNRIDIINKDMLLKTSVKNQLTKFLNDQNLTNNNVHKEHIFMGDYFKYCSLWFNKILIDIPMTFDNLVMNEVFMEIVKGFQSYLVIGEQLIKIMEIALVWVATKLESSFCVSREELLKWRLEIIENLQNLRIEEILYKYNFYNSFYLENLSDHHLLLETILSRVRTNIEKLPTKRLNDVVTIVIEIAKITKIDIKEFACQFTKVGLKLVAVSQDSYCESEGDLSMLNTSCEISIDESRLEKKEYIYVDIHELEILSQNVAIRVAVKNSLFKFIEENMLTLQQWNNIFLYFFHTFRISEDQDVDYLCTSHWYCAFQIFLELHLMNIQKYNFTEISNQEYIIKKKLREFSLQDKTSIVKQLYCGKSNETNTKRSTATKSPHHIAVLKDIINKYPETIDFHDEDIKTIRAEVYSKN